MKIADYHSFFFFRLATSNLYMVIATLVMHFDFEFPFAKAEDFECSSEQFTIGSTGGGMLLTKVKRQLK